MTSITYAGACPASSRRQASTAFAFAQISRSTGSRWAPRPGPPCSTRVPCTSLGTGQSQHRAGRDPGQPHHRPAGCPVLLSEHRRLGDPDFDEHGFPLLDCSRGTIDVECPHKADRDNFRYLVQGGRDAGPPTRRAAGAAATSACRGGGAVASLRSGTTTRGSSTCFCYLWGRTTPCTLAPRGPTRPTTLTRGRSAFGMILLHSAKMAKALKAAMLSAGATFTAEQQYLGQRIGTPAQLLPVHGEAYLAYGSGLRLGGYSRLEEGRRHQDIPQAAPQLTHAPCGMDAEPACVRGNEIGG
jgi:hypothetical protein